VSASVWTQLIVGSHNGRVDSEWLPPGASPPVMPLPLPSYLTQLSDRIRREAIDLRPQQVAAVGFHVQPALDAVGELETHSVAVLGADTWTVRDGEQPRVFPSLGWAVAHLAAQEEWQDYVRRAASYARERIKGADLYARDGGWGTLIFALVPSDQRRYEELNRGASSRDG
jgi:hypothetical protein